MPYCYAGGRLAGQLRAGTGVGKGAGDIYIYICVLKRYFRKHPKNDLSSDNNVEHGKPDSLPITANPPTLCLHQQHTTPHTCPQHTPWFPHEQKIETPTSTSKTSIT